VEYSIWSCSTSYSKITIALKAYAPTPPLIPMLNTDSSLSAATASIFASTIAAITFMLIDSELTTYCHFEIDYATAAFD